MNARYLALRAVRHATGVLRAVNPTQAQAMAAELDYIADDRTALVFALGCVAAAYRQRASVLTVGIVAGRWLTALAAGLFGLTHILLSGQNLVLKLLLMAGLPGTLITRGAHHIQGVEDMALSHWLWRAIVIGGMGVLHLAAASAVLKGEDRDLTTTALAVVALALLMPFMGTGALTLPVIYIGLITLAVAAGLFFSRLWRWETARLRGRRPA